jgi:hypothetical protein
MQKIKGAQDVKLSLRSWIPEGDSLLKILNNSNDKTLEDIENLRKIFAKNSNFCVSDMLLGKIKVFIF